MFQSCLDLHPPWCPSPVNIPGSCLSDHKTEHCSIGKPLSCLFPGKAALVPGCEFGGHTRNVKCIEISAVGQPGKANPQNLVVSKSQSSTSHWDHSLYSLLFDINANIEFFLLFWGIFDIFKARWSQ